MHKSKFWFRNISIHAPRAGGDQAALDKELAERDFNPRPPCGGRHRGEEPKRANRDFNPRPPCGGRQQRLGWWKLPRQNFNPRPPCGGRLTVDTKTYRYEYISIHAPRAGGDPALRRGVCQPNRISIHAPRAGGDFGYLPTVNRVHISIHAPRAGGDDVPCVARGALRDFNPRPPCGGRLNPVDIYLARTPISIHAPRAGGDVLLFLPDHNHARISIHAPRAGGDQGRRRYSQAENDFNPRPPCGGRHRDKLFSLSNEISIHAPRAGGDINGCVLVRKKFSFQSTPPVRGATLA